MSLSTISTFEKNVPVDITGIYSNQFKERFSIVTGYPGTVKDVKTVTHN